MEVTGNIIKLAEKFYYLMDAAGGKSSMDRNSSAAEVNDYLGCTKEDFDKALGFLVEKGVVEVGSKGTSIIATWESKIGKNVI